ncbi:hypothetical protein [Methylobacterium indicum]|uniref:hypothetical protein n=1 Tax=Methylobacterium indicum TaxID=1775910 RepID=UPI000A885CCA|nr:hypothetical protein [Methylobacterium indicum]
MTRDYAAEPADLAAAILAAASRLRENDLPGCRCAMRCATAATNRVRDLAAFLNEDAALDHPRGRQERASRTVAQ